MALVLHIRKGEVYDMSYAAIRKIMIVFLSSAPNSVRSIGRSHPNAKATVKLSTVNEICG